MQIPAIALTKSVSNTDDASAAVLRCAQNAPEAADCRFAKALSTCSPQLKGIHLQDVLPPSRRLHAALQTGVWTRSKGCRGLSVSSFEKVKRNEQNVKIAWWGSE